MALLAFLAPLLAASTMAVGGTTQIKADNVHYDRKNGMSFFSGHVSVADERYQMYADRAYVFMGPSNDLKRVVALGHVAITNDTKRAYGTRATYFREQGFVVLSAGSNGVAEVRNEAPSGAQVLKGRKIRFWTATEQVEVEDATITAPTSGSARDLKKRMGGGW